MANFTRGLTPLPFFEENLVPHYEFKHQEVSINFLMFGEITEFRVRTLLTKEPETIEWIKSFEKGDSFWDIGANIGVFSLYAAAMGMKVRSFEPSPVNFWLLAENVSLNNFSSNLEVYPFAISDDNEILHWNPHHKAGSADNQIPSQFSVSQQATRVGRRINGSVAVQSFSIDYLTHLNITDFPQHIKIDVDGVEKRIINGARDTLSDTRLKSVLIEINEDDDDSLKTILKIMYDSDFAEPIMRHLPYMEDSHYAPVFNYIFLKKEALACAKL